jgi:glycine cleavage system H protein
MRILQCSFPEGLLYDVENNSWAKRDGEMVVVGINSILSWISGVFASVKFKEKGSQVSRGGSLGWIEGPRHFDVVRSPFTGEVSEYNEALQAKPRLLNSDPYGAGWFARLRPLRFQDEARLLNDVTGAKEGLERKLRELRVHCFVEFPDYEMFEIGVECSAVIVKLNELFEGVPVGTVVHIASDDPSADIEMRRWSYQTGNRVLEARLEDNVYHFIAKKKGG